MSDTPGLPAPPPSGASALPAAAGFGHVIHYNHIFLLGDAPGF